MQVFIYDLNSNKKLNITCIIADAMGVDIITEDSAEAIQLGADYARDYFGHNNIDCASE